MDHIPFGVVLSTFHSVPEQTLRFRCFACAIIQVRLPFRQLPIEWRGV